MPGTQRMREYSLKWNEQEFSEHKFRLSEISLSPEEMTHEFGGGFDFLQTLYGIS